VQIAHTGFPGHLKGIAIFAISSIVGISHQNSLDADQPRHDVIDRIKRSEAALDDDTVRRTIGMPAGFQTQVNWRRTYMGGLSGYIKYCGVSNIDQRLRKPEAHVGSITVRHWPLPVTESVALPPDLRRA
jgi:hypothetical protein